MIEYGVFDTYSDGDIVRCILKLPHDFLEVILLKFDLGLSNREIADTLGISQALVRKRLQRARAELRTIFEMEGIADVTI